MKQYNPYVSEIQADLDNRFISLTDLSEVEYNHEQLVYNSETDARENN